MASPEPDGATATVVFVDLVRFTSLTDIHGDRAGADAATALTSITEAVLGSDARLVKTAGDGVLVTASTPLAGLRCAARLIEGIHDRHLGLDARGGLDHGPVIERDNDIFGSTVNLAARLSAMAEPGYLLLTRPVALAAGEMDLAVNPLGATEVRGFSNPIELFAADPCRHDDDWTTDPVCGMRLRADQVAELVSEGDAQFGFCSSRCAELFAASPARYTEER